MGFVHHKAVKTELFKGKRGIFREESLIVLNINPRNTDTGGYIASFEFRRQNGRQSRYVPLIIGIVLCIEFSSTQRVVVIVLAENLFVCAVVDISEYEPPAPL